MKENPTIFILPHAGLGDHLVSNAIYRHFAQTHNVVIPVKKHNVSSVQFMLRGLPVAILQVEDDEEAKTLFRVAQKRCDTLALGMFGKGFYEKDWDREFFRMANIPFEDRWNKWHVERDLSREFEPQIEPYVFIHEDRNRGFQIKEALLPKINRYRVMPNVTDNIFNYCQLIEEATEIHVIDSCFAILADSLPKLKAKRFVVHAYARPNALPPSYRNNVELLRE